MTLPSLPKLYAYFDTIIAVNVFAENIPFVVVFSPSGTITWRLRLYIGGAGVEAHGAQMTYKHIYNTT